MNGWGALLGFSFVAVMVMGCSSAFGIFSGWPMWVTALLLVGATVFVVLLIYAGGKYAEGGRKR